MRYYVALLLLVAGFTIPWANMTHPAEWSQFVSGIGSLPDDLAAVILAHNPKTVADIKARYVSDPFSRSPKVRVLIVPGHEPDYGGAEYKDLKERDMAVELAQDLKGFLDVDQHFQSFMTRDANAWSPGFAAYFKNNWDDIIAWQKASHAQESQLIKIGSVPAPVSTVYHNKAPEDVAFRLYGITKWANENDIDITIHIHFNDSPDRRAGEPGTHSGFAIYVPAAQYGNSSTTKAVASAVFKRLKKYNPVSDLTGESNGIIDEPKLIAVGVDNTADSASMLIEYGYLYEQQFQDPAVRSIALKDLAYQTYLGLQDFFSPTNTVDLSKRYDSLALPHSWQEPITDKNTVGPDVFALQTALEADGEYPPIDQTANDCPRSGRLGPCTKTAIQAFQNKYKIHGESGVVGSTTIGKLNQLFSL